MAVVIHHGPNGSFKSFGVVQRFAIPALQEGRTVVTNIKGFDDIDRICDVLGIEIPPEAELLYIDTQGNDDAKAHMARWFHWVPFGALVVIDECQMIYREGRGGFDPDSVTIQPGTVEPVRHINDRGEEKLIERPRSIWEAFERHRHFEWDVFLCSPNIGKIHKQLRLNTEWAYRHREMTGVLPWKIKPCWREVQHDPENNGKSLSHIIQKKDFKADPRIWQCYSSTETGTYREKPAKLQIFKDPRLLGMLALMVIGGIVSLSSLASYLDQRDALGPGVALDDSADTGSGSDVFRGGDINRRSGSDTVVYSRESVIAIKSLSFELRRILGYATEGRRQRYLFEVAEGDDSYTVTSDELSMMGFQVYPINNCMARVVVGDDSYLVVCRRVHEDRIDPDQLFDSGQQMIAGN